MALEVSVNEIESAAVGGPGSEGMKSLIEKMGKADRTFPSKPDENDLTRAFKAFMGRDEADLYKAMELTIPARGFARSTKKLLGAIQAKRERAVA